MRKLIRIAAQKRLQVNSLSNNIRKFSAFPTEFFQEEIERDREFLDIASASRCGGVEFLTSEKASLTWNEITKINSGFKVSESAALFDKSNTITVDDDGGLSDEDAMGTTSFPSSYLNEHVEWKDLEDEDEENPLIEFSKDTSSLKYSVWNQGDRPCPGKRQRKGKSGKLLCHKIDLLQLHYLNTLQLSTYLSKESEILGRSDTGLCAKCQRKVSKTIKRARSCGVLNHIGDFEIQTVKTSNRLHRDSKTLI